MAGKQEPVVEEALKRFHLHAVKERTEQFRLELEAAKVENDNLTLQLQLARASLWFYAAGNKDDGTSAKSALGAMTSHISAPRD